MTRNKYFIYVTWNHIFETLVSVVNTFNKYWKRKLAIGMTGNFQNKTNKQKQNKKQNNVQISVG